MAARSAERPYHPRSVTYKSTEFNNLRPSPPQIGNILIRAVSGGLNLRGAKILGFRAAARPKILIQGGREGSKICVARYARRF